ncbi:MAG: hypothetical protein HN702_02520 [Flavobacteriales bacterium]|jgi:YD repeat-containing protein|nr:hypothetical protein [Flavobacteriales bacterium]MBT5353486.1 hypothetical protein [Flavobacteriales bacterium]MBT5698759.1 hypothetical protein [Flavobacteriales bacterium]MBT7726246.1 hypothetical protein [Flavobacteriales bacterium]
MKKLLLLLLCMPLIFSCGENYEKEKNQEEIKRPKSFLELWKVKGNVKSAEYTMYSVSEKFGEIKKEDIIEDPFFDSDEWFFGNKKSILNKFGDIKKISVYNNEGNKIAGRVVGFNSDEIPISIKWEDNLNHQKGRGEFKLDRDDYSKRFYGYNENSNLTSIEIYKRNKDGRIIKSSTFYSVTSWSNENFEEEVLRNQLEPDLLLEWKYDATGNWIETSRYINNELVSVTKLEYDKFDNRVSHRIYDGEGNLDSRWEYKDKDNMGNWTSRIRYDKNNNAEYLQEYKFKYYD